MKNQVISEKKKKKKGLRRNRKAFSGRNYKFKRFFWRETGDLQKKKGHRRNRKVFSGRNHKFKRFFGPKPATFSSPKNTVGARNKSGAGGQKRKSGEHCPPAPPLAMRLVHYLHKTVR